MKLKCLEVMGGEGGVFISCWRDQGGHHNGAIWWKWLGRKGEGKARACSGRAEFNTKPFPKTLSLGAPAKSSAATI